MNAQPEPCGCWYCRSAAGIRFTPPKRKKLRLVRKLPPVAPVYPAGTPAPQVMRLRHGHRTPRHSRGIG